jgi:hypothetical protein
MASTYRLRLHRDAIESKAEQVISHFDPYARRKNRSPIYEVVRGLREQFNIRFYFDQDLGLGKSGKKILGRFDFRPRQIFVHKVLPWDSPRFRWTLCHEVGHLVLHRRLTASAISRDPAFVDTKEQLRFVRTGNRSEKAWIEWQANQFAAALLLPRAILQPAVTIIHRQLGIPRPGCIYLDDQHRNYRDYAETLRLLAERLNASKTMLRIRLLHLGTLVDARRLEQDHVGETTRRLLSDAIMTIGGKGAVNL